jgi:hypothetical protein
MGHHGEGSIPPEIGTDVVATVLVKRVLLVADLREINISSVLLISVCVCWCVRERNEEERGVIISYTAILWK